MPESGEHDLFGVQFPMITSKDLAFAFQAWLRWLGVNPNVAEARRVTTLVRSFSRTFEEEELEAIGRAVPQGEMFEGVREVVRLELERRVTLGK